MNFTFDFDFFFFLLWLLEILILHIGFWSCFIGQDWSRVTLQKLSILVSECWTKLHIEKNVRGYKTVVLKASWNKSLPHTYWDQPLWGGRQRTSKLCFNKPSRGLCENHGYRTKFTTNVLNHLKLFSNRTMLWPCNDVLFGLTAPRIPYGHKDKQGLDTVRPPRPPRARGAPRSHKAKHTPRLDSGCQELWVSPFNP